LQNLTSSLPPPHSLILQITGVEITPKDAVLNMQRTGRIMMEHIQALWLKYPKYRTKPIVIVPENNTEHAAASLALYLEDANMQRQHPFQHAINISVLHRVDQNGNPEVLAGITTGNSNKTTAVTRLEARLKKGPSSICLSTLFLTCTSAADGEHVQPMEYILARMRREFRSFRTVPPTLDNKHKVVTYSSKIVGETDDFIMALLMVELGNAELEKQMMMRRLQAHAGN
jgi:hypothetical protein